MSTFQRVEETVEVPRGAGIEAFVRTVRAMLALPRVQELHIDARGVVRCTRYAPKDEPHVPVRVNFDPLMPYALVRAATIVALPPASGHAAVALLGMFEAAAKESMAPLAWVTGRATALWRWLEETTGVQGARTTLFGLPVHGDPQLEDDVVLLATAFAPGGDLLAVQKTYKLGIPETSLWCMNKSFAG